MDGKASPLTFLFSRCRRGLLLQGSSSFSMAASSSGETRSLRITPPSRSRMLRMYSIGWVAGIVVIVDLGQYEGSIGGGVGRGIRAIL